MRFSNALFAGILVGTARATLMSRAVTLPTYVQLLQQPATEEIVTLQIALRLRNIDRLEYMLRSVSDPASPDYGKYFDHDDANTIFNPSSDSRAAVLQWLKESNVTKIADFGSYINFATTIEHADKLLQSSFQYFLVDGTPKLRTREYYVPDDLAEHIDLVSPTTFFGRTRARAHHAPPSRDLLAYIQDSNTPALNCTPVTPSCLQKLYNYGGYLVDLNSTSRVGFGSFLNQSARQEDLSLYQRAYHLPETNFSVVLINGGEDHQDPLGDIKEANLDLQLISAVAQGLPITEFITGGRPPFVPNLDVPDTLHNTNEPYLEYYQYLLNMSDPDLPQVITNSYGEDEQTVPLEYATRVCNLIGIMGLRGVTVIESSGDTGVGAPCQSNDGKATPQFTPQFPATCPYILSVGGTQSYAPEVAWDDSSGGFSNYFAQPWYQTDGVSTYLSSVISEETRLYYTPFANFSGRAFPDISAHSHWPFYSIFSGGRTSLGAGTSASAPVVAGIIALLNDARLQKGDPPLGFANPWLYGPGRAALTDVTAGQARGCTGANPQTGRLYANSSVIPWATWNGTGGWDPVTGWGLPNFWAMMGVLNGGSVAAGRG
ncbi:Subtilisin-like protein [Pleurostoma richardsiae]|uniref:tripeptidyl-peptidase II n=1 Tax=Pleurostoma richardsiae TaxID=41990 RepID=A0AA38RF06_9PEZI|nr:Subtilisin-like protein [Pleurostoma richardsiae]